MKGEHLHSPLLKQEVSFTQETGEVVTDTQVLLEAQEYPEEQVISLEQAPPAPTEKDVLQVPEMQDNPG